MGWPVRGWAGHPQALPAHGRWWPCAGRAAGACVSRGRRRVCLVGPKERRTLAGACWVQPVLDARECGAVAPGGRLEARVQRTVRERAPKGRGRGWDARGPAPNGRQHALHACGPGLYALEPAFDGRWPVAGTRAVRPRVRTGSPVSAAASACVERGRATACALPCPGRSRVQVLGQGRRLARFRGAPACPLAVLITSVVNADWS